MAGFFLSVLAFFGSIFGFLTHHNTSPASQSAAVVEASQPAPVPNPTSATSMNEKQTVINNYITNPVIERTVVKTVSSSEPTPAHATQLADLQKQVADMHTALYGTGGIGLGQYAGGGYFNNTALAQKVDSLPLNTTVNGAPIATTQQLSGYLPTVGGTANFTILQSGNVGIGTQNPTANLEVSGEARFDGNVTNNYIWGDYTWNAAYDGAWKYIADGPASRMEQEGDTGGLQFFTAPSGTAGHAISSEYENLFLAPNGRVGIGTTNPASSLEVAGTGITLGGVTRTTWPTGSGTGFGVDAGTHAYYMGGNVGFGTTTPAYPFEVYSGGHNQLIVDPSGMGGTWINNEIDGGEPSAPFTLHLNTFSQQPVDILGKAIFTPSGNVGIGTTTPNVALNVIGDVATDGTVTSRQLGNLGGDFSPGQLTFKAVAGVSADSSKYTDPSMAFYAYNASSTLTKALGYIQFDGNYANNGTLTNPNFYILNANGGTGPLSIDLTTNAATFDGSLSAGAGTFSGNVGVGTTTPTAQLALGGTGSAVPNNYGLYIDDKKGGTNNYNIWSGPGVSAFSSYAQGVMAGGNSANIFAVGPSSNTVNAVSIVAEGPNPTALYVLGSATTTSNGSEGLFAYAGFGGTGTVGGVPTAAISAEVDNTNSGSITNGIGLDVYPGTNTGGGSIANLYGLRVQDQAAGTNNHNIWSGLPISAFDADVQGTFSYGKNVFTVLNSGDYSGAVSIGKQGHTNVEVGLDMVLECNPSGTQGNCIGFNPYVQMDGTGATINFAAFEPEMNNDSTGNITNAISFHSKSITNGAGGTVTNTYGLKVEDQTVGTNNYAIKTGLGRVSFGDKVGIGTSSPYSRLTVFGSDTSGATAAVTIANSASTTEFQVFDNGNATLAGTLTQNSDIRLKTNVASLDGSSTLGLVNQLNPVSFNWIDGSQGSTTFVGFIAQEVQKLFPSLVSTTSPTTLTPDGTLGVNYIGFVAPIIKAIQALYAEVKNLEVAIAGFAASFTTKELCVGDSSDKTCITKVQLDALLAGQPQPQPQPQTQLSTATPSDGSGTSTPPAITIEGTTTWSGSTDASSTDVQTATSSSADTPVPTAATTTEATPPAQ